MAESYTCAHIRPAGKQLRVVPYAFRRILSAALDCPTATVTVCKMHSAQIQSDPPKRMMGRMHTRLIEWWRNVRPSLGPFMAG